MLTRIKVKNFRSIVDTGEISLSNKLTYIVGKNGAGKSNLLLAIKLAVDICSGTELDKAVQNISIAPAELFNYNPQTELSEISIVVNGGTTEYLYELKIGLNTDNSVRKPIIKSEILKKNAEILLRRQDLELSNKEGKVIPLALDHKTSAIFLYKEPSVDEFKNKIGSVKFMDLLVNDAFSAYADDTKLARELVMLKTTNPDRFDALNEFRQKLIPSIASIKEHSLSINSKSDRNTDVDDYLLVIETAVLKKKLSIRSQSIGDIKTLCLLIKLLSAKENSTLFVEEFENSFHNHRAKDLIELIRSLTYKLNLQIVMTTHSSTLINSAIPSEVLFTRLSDTKGTEFISLRDQKHVGGVQEVLEDGGELTDYLNNIK